MHKSPAFAMRLILGSSSVVVTDQGSLHEITLTIALQFHEFVEHISNNDIRRNNFEVKLQCVLKEE